MDTDADIEMEFATGYNGAMVLIIDAKAINGNGSNICYRNYNISANQDNKVIVELSFEIPDAVTKLEFDWQWTITAIPKCYVSGPLYKANTITQTTEQTFYVLYDEPVAPMENPWARVLEHACNFAGGAKSENEAIEYLITNFYENSGIEYDNYSHYRVIEDSEGEPDTCIFYLTEFLNEWSSADCQDCSMFTSILCSAIGTGLNSTGTLQAQGVSFTTLLVDPIGEYFSDQRYQFIFHQICWYNGLIYDSSLRLFDNNNIKYIPIGVNENQYAKDFTGDVNPGYDVYDAFILGEPDTYFSVYSKIE